MEKKYRLVRDIAKSDYIDFVSKVSDLNFLNTYEWGEFQSSIGKNVYRLGLFEGDKLVAVTTLIQTDLMLGYSHFYAPKGYVLDYLNNEVLAEFTENIKNFVKEHKGIFLKIDPDIIIRRNDEVTVDYKSLIDSMNQMGYEHLGFTKNFETVQPRFSYEIQLEEDFYSKFNKSTKRNVKVGSKFIGGVDELNGDTIDIFFDLLKVTEDRKNFVSYGRDYYMNLLSMFPENVKIYSGYVLKSENINRFKEDLEILIKNRKKLGDSQNKKYIDNEKKITALNEKIDKFSMLELEKTYLNAYFVIFVDGKGWVLYGGNSNLLMNARTTYSTYFEMINRLKQSGLKKLDQFGAVAKDGDENLIGLNAFKEGFGGDYVEFIGDFTLVTNKFMNSSYSILAPIRRKLRAMFKKSK